MIYTITIENGPKGWHWSCKGHTDPETGEPVEMTSIPPHHDDTPRGAVKLAQVHIAYHADLDELAILGEPT